MITDALLLVVTWVIDGLEAVIPDWTVTLPESVGGLISALFAYDAVVPVTETMACLGLFCGATLAMLGWKWSVHLVGWIMDVIP